MPNLDQHARSVTSLDMRPHFDVERGLFEKKFDRQDFGFSHRLADSPLFTFDALRHLTREMAKNPDDVYYDAGDVGIGQRWADVAPTKLSVNDVLADMETANGWILLRRTDKFPEYAALMDACIAEIEDLAGRDLKPLMAKRRALIFINSPHRISSYHIDRECNFLLQIRGSKTISVFDRDDRDVLPETEIERFWTVDNNAATYKPEYEHRANVYELVPGRAIHIPVNAPHWVRNGADISVSLSINFHYVESYRADLYKVNHWLRAAGIATIPPGRSPMADSIKRSAFAAASAMRRAIRRQPRKEYY